MIELLIKYIQDKGFAVDVHPGRLDILKNWHDEIVGVSWMISKIDLRYAYEEVLYYEADKLCKEIDEMIELREHPECIPAMWAQVKADLRNGR